MVLLVFFCNTIYPGFYVSTETYLLYSIDFFSCLSLVLLQKIKLSMFHVNKEPYNYRHQMGPLVHQLL